jgi:hypothetical protein
LGGVTAFASAAGTVGSTAVVSALDPAVFAGAATGDCARAAGFGEGVGAAWDTAGMFRDAGAAAVGIGAAGPRREAVCCALSGRGILTAAAGGMLDAVAATAAATGCDSGATVVPTGGGGSGGSSAA